MQNNIESTKKYYTNGRLNKNIPGWLMLPAILLFLTACKNVEKNNTQTITDTAQSIRDSPKLKTVQATTKSNVNKIACEFISYNDDGDYFLMNVRKDGEEISFINDNIESRDLLRGDLIEITWKQDTIYIAGDGDTPELADWILKVKKIKDGKLSLFKKKYTKPIKYWYGEEENYSDDYKNKLYNLVQYYLANSEKKLVKLNIDNNYNLVYSIEQQKRDGSNYTMLGVSTDFEDHSSIIQWLFYNPANDKLYEYDLPNDKLILFDK